MVDFIASLIEGGNPGLTILKARSALSFALRFKDNGLWRFGGDVVDVEAGADADVDADAVDLGGEVEDEFLRFNEVGFSEEAVVVLVVVFSGILANSGGVIEGDALAAVWTSTLLDMIS